MLKELVRLFVICAPITSFFAISAWLRLPIIVLLITYLVAFMYLIFAPKIKKKFFSLLTEELLFTIFLGIVWTSFIFGFLNSRSFNHALAYSFSIILYYLGFRFVIQYSGSNSNLILKSFTFIAFLSTIFISIDWFLVNFLDIKLRDYFVEVDYKIANMNYYIKGYFITVGGFAEEPGSMSFFINIIAPLGLVYLKVKNNKNYYILLVLYIASLIFLGSTAAFLGAFIAFIIVQVLPKFYLKNWVIKRSNVKLFATGLLFTGFVFIYFYKSFIKIFSEILIKVQLSDTDISASGRAYTWKEALSNWVENPILGNGPGYGVDKYGSGYMSVYLTILADLGIFAILIFLVSLLIVYKRILKLKNAAYRKYFLFVYLTCIFHFGIIGDFYHAPFWLFLVLVGLVYREQSDLLMNSENINSNSSI